MDALLAQNKPRPIRIVASGTLFNTNVLTLPTMPTESSVSRARTVSRTRGGSVANVLITLGQFSSVEPMLVAPLAGNNEGAMMVRDLEREGVNTRFCKVWEGASVPSAWVLESGTYPPIPNLFYLISLPPRRRVWLEDGHKSQPVA